MKLLWLMLSIVMIMAVILPIHLTTMPNTVNNQSKLHFTDDFSDPKSGWGINSTEEYQVKYQDSAYHVIANKARSIFWGMNNGHIGKPGDFTINVDVKLQYRDGIDQHYCGIVFRQQDNNNLYFFVIKPIEGNYFLQKNLNGTWSRMVDATDSPYINKDNNINNLKLICTGEQIQFFINDHHLGTVNDSSFVQGKIGLAAATSDNTDYTEAVFDNFKITSP